MRSNNAIYGGELSAHHYFRDFAYCDSGIIPCLIMIELISKAEKSLGELLKTRFEKLPSSGEKNFRVKSPQKVVAVLADTYEKHGKVDTTDGLSVEFDNWRFNIRESNTETLIRLNVEAFGSKNVLKRKIDEVLKVIDKFTST